MSKRFLSQKRKKDRENRKLRWQKILGGGEEEEEGEEYFVFMWAEIDRRSGWEAGGGLNRLFLKKRECRHKWSVIGTC